MLLEMAFEAVRQLSSEKQDKAARAMLNVVNGAEEEVPFEAEKSAIDFALAQVKRGELATEAEVEAILARYGRRGSSSRLQRLNGLQMTRIGW
jgi:hypothetical protein